MKMAARVSADQQSTYAISKHFIIYAMEAEGFSRMSVTELFAAEVFGDDCTRWNGWQPTMSADVCKRRGKVLRGKDNYTFDKATFLASSCNMES